MALDKEALKAALVAHLRGGVGSDLSQITQEGADAGNDAQMVRDAEALGDSSGDLHALLQRAEAKDDDAAAHAEALSTEPCDSVEPGAVVEMDGRNYIVGVSSTPFMFDGAVFAGFSTSAPVYSTIKGLHAGENFSFADGEHHIGAVS